MFKDYKTKYDRLNKRPFNFFEALWTMVLLGWFAVLVAWTFINLIMGI